MALVHTLGWDAQFLRRSPWFWPLSQAAQTFADCNDWPTLADFDALYEQRVQAVDAPALRFASNVRKQDKRAAGRVVLDALYDGRIALHNQVPTRERDWHDFFNMLCFVTFPHAKRALHTRQYHAQAARVAPDADKLPNARTPEQDALTLFDEGGAVIAVDAHGAQTLVDMQVDGNSALLTAVQSSGHARVVPFGHALFEHLVEGLRCPGGATQIVQLEALPSDPTALIEQVDRALAAALRNPANFSSPRVYCHLRLDELGIVPVRS